MVETDSMVVWGIPYILTRQVTEYSFWSDGHRWASFRVEYRLFNQVIHSRRFSR